MGIYERYGTSKELEENGVWVEFDDGVQLLLARIKSKRSLAAKKAAEKPYREVLRTASRLSKDVSEDIQTKVALEWMSNGVVLDWKGITDRSGKKLPFSAEQAKRVFVDLPDFLDDVITAASSQEMFQEVSTDLDSVGNSLAGSAGSSSGAVKKVS